MQEKARHSELLIKILLFTTFVALLIFQNTQHISDRMFWLDEVTTFKIAILPFWKIPYATTISSGHMQPPLFYWLGHIATYVGSTPIILRSVSVTCYILLLWFVIFRMHEMRIASRFTLCFILIVTPFASFATTEFRPYALAALSILVSSTFLFRLFQQPSGWPQALMYGLSALILQYSLTLNCFVFGVQMFFIFLYIAASFFKIGMKESLQKHKPAIIVAILLCIPYALFLFGVSTSPSSQQHYQVNEGSLAVYIEHLATNWQVLFESISIHSWTRYVVFCFFVLGCLYGLIVNLRISLYLLFIFVGQLLFSTFMTYDAIPWFTQRYLVASYIAFALICALGAEALFRQLGKRISIVLVTLLVISPLFNAVESFSLSRNKPSFNASTALVEWARCNDTKTVVLSDPTYLNAVPWYAYLNDSAIIVPYYKKDIDATISNGFSQKYCFVLQEKKNHGAYTGAYVTKLSAMSDYAKIPYRTPTEGTGHVPGSGWLFIPNERVTSYINFRKQ